MLSLQDLFNEKDFTSNEKYIIDYICRNPNLFLMTPITELSDKLHVSDATLSRFARHAGFATYKDLKEAVALTIEKTGPAEKMKNTVISNSSSRSFLTSFLETQQNYLEKTMELIDHDAFHQAVDLLAECPHIYVHGKGAAVSLANLLTFRLNRFGKNVTLLPSGGSELFEGLNNISKNDIVVTFGFQKLPKEVQVILKYREESGYKAILFGSRIYTDSKTSGDINLFIYRGEADEYHSMTAPIAVIDAMIVEIAAKLGNSAVEHLDKLHSLKKKYAADIP